MRIIVMGKSRVPQEKETVLAGSGRVGEMTRPGWLSVTGKGGVLAPLGWVGVMLLMFLLAACASEDFWYQKGKTEADMQIDRYECTTELRDKYGMYGADKNSPAYVADLRQCMIKKGYTRLEDTKK
jgi:hypothetical protein